VTNTNLAYFQRRAAEERNAARDSQNRRVRGIHLELADAYETHWFLLQQLAALKAGEPLSLLGELAAAIATEAACATPHDKGFG